jgi:hypothetical protein
MKIFPLLLPLLFSILLSTLLPTLAVHAQTFPEKSAQELVQEALAGITAEGYVDRHDVRIKSIQPFPNDPEAFEVTIEHVFKGIEDSHDRFWITKKKGQTLSVYEVVVGDRENPLLSSIYLLHEKTRYFSGDAQEWIDYPKVVEQDFREKGKVDFRKVENSLLSQLAQAL